MHPVLRLSEDFLTDRGVLSLPALPRMLYVVRGAVRSARARCAPGEACYSEDAVTARAERDRRDAVALGALDRRASRRATGRA